MIVAFPGETDEEYEATLELMRTVRYDDAFLYKYCERDGTPATRLPRDQFVPDEIGQARLERLIETHRAIQAEIYRAEVGRMEEVLVEKEGRRGGLQGRTESNKVVTFDGPGGADRQLCRGAAGGHQRRHLPGRAVRTRWRPRERRRAGFPPPRSRCSRRRSRGSTAASGWRSTWAWPPSTARR